jgi:hypothetical protein
MATSLIVFLVVFGGIAIAVGPGFVLYRVARFRARLRQELAAQGYAVRALNARWLTRGSFPDLAPSGVGRKMKREYLFRVLAEDRGGIARSGWVRWRVPLWWHREEEWVLKWDDTLEHAAKGVPSLLFYAMVLVAIAVVTTLLAQTEQFAMLIRALMGAG